MSLCWSTAQRIPKNPLEPSTIRQPCSVGLHRVPTHRTWICPSCTRTSRGSSRFDGVAACMLTRPAICAGYWLRSTVTAPAYGSKYAFLARPRRFGKTLLVSTLEGLLPRRFAAVGEVPARLPLIPMQGEREAAVPRIPPSRMLVHRQTRVHPVVRLNHGDDQRRTTPEGVAYPASGAHSKDVYTNWHARGVATGIEPRIAKAGYGSVSATTRGFRCRFPQVRSPALTCCMNLNVSFKAKPVVLIDEYDAPLTHLLGRDIDPGALHRESCASSSA